MRAHNNRELPIRATGDGDQFGSANIVHNQTHTTKGDPNELSLLYQLESSLDNLASTAINKKSVLEQMVANSAKLTNSNAARTTNNKKLTGEVKELLLALKKKGGGPNGPHSCNERFDKDGY